MKKTIIIPFDKVKNHNEDQLKKEVTDFLSTHPGTTELKIYILYDNLIERGIYTLMKQAIVLSEYCESIPGVTLILLTSPEKAALFNANFLLN
jgi:hypothetical protein